MGEQAGEENASKQICIGILAHVDAGKTTLSERILFASGAIRKMGRVDKGDTLLDDHALEREIGRASCRERV